jgi:hypothetical protein
VPADPGSWDSDEAEALAGYLDELERLCNAATPGPWTAHEDDEDKEGWSFKVHDAPGPIIDCMVASDARFIEAARYALPKLIAKVRELQAEDTGVRQHFATFCEWWCREKAQSEEAVEGALELAERFRRGEVQR